MINKIIPVIHLLIVIFISFYYLTLKVLMNFLNLNFILYFCHFNLCYLNLRHHLRCFTKAKFFIFGYPFILNL